jgi:hypothetical protein
VETAHYHLRYAGTPAAAREAGAVLEAAWPQWRAFFGTEPPRPKDGRLEVRFFGDRAAWARGLTRAKVGVPAGAGGYYDPGTRTAYLYAQPTTYFTRVLLLHEATHQFHFLACTGNRAPTAAWYTEGLAEYLSWHRWDGAKLDLAVLPGVSLKDYAAAARGEISAGNFDLGAVVAGRTPASRAVAWALMRYLATGRDGKPLEGFAAFRHKMDRGGRAGSLFRACFGPPRRVQPRLLAWLRDHQAPWAQVFNEWEQVGPAALRGHAAVVTACRLKQAATRLQAQVDLPASGRWRAGLLLHWTGRGDYTVALVTSAGAVEVDRRQGDRWQRLQRAAWERPAGGRVALEAVRTGASVAFLVDGRRIGAFDLPGRTLGLALEGADLRFRSVSWR